ncbi:phage tail tape measure protein [Pseudomonas luteola]|uniref:phage tail tape measure protein n=1 Tax=Pseudomonas luteola TaxID=47886 RepID=UPI00123C5AC0|nr:phage tail tape measure protein [Pseudomonas luteola]QEU28921.1 phage tail tape measure protein [Pseudomonas luteola]
MANDIASLGLRVDSSEVERGSESLDKLAKSGARAEQATRKFEESAEKAKESVKSEKDEIARLLGQIDPTTKAFERLDQQERKLYQLRAANKLDLDTYTQYRQKIDEGREALARANDGLTRTGNTAKQTANALRGVPAQFTDIVVSLQGGQQPLTVLLQQGGQLKDMFGGIGPAARALGGYVLGLVNPFTVAAAAAALLALAYKQGSDEASGYTKALIVTGNQSGQTADSMAALAKQVSAITGTTGAAANALTQIAATGVIASNQFKNIAIAAVAFESATGQAVEETVAQFQRLAEDPAKASAELNKQYNYLTASVYEQIRALQEQGDTVGAANLAEESYASALQGRSNAIKQNLGSIEGAWNAIKGAAKNAYDAMLNVGRDQTLDERIASLQASLDKAANQRPRSFKDMYALGDKDYITPEAEAGFRLQLQFLTQQRDTQRSLALAEEQRRTNERAAIEGSNALHAAYLSGLDKEAKKKKDIADLDRARANALKGDGVDAVKVEREYQAALKGIEDKYKEKPTQAKAYQDDAATRMLANLNQQEAVLREQLSSSEKLTGSRRELAQFEQQIADLRGKEQLTAEQKSLLASELQIRAELETNVELEKQLATREQLNKLAERSAQIQESAANSLRLQQEQYDRQLQGAGLGSQARERIEAQRSIYREFQRYQEQLDKATPKDALGSEEYKRASQSIQDSLNTALQANRDYYNELDKQNEDWSVGASDAFNDYLDSARNVAGQTREMFSNAFSNMEDGIVNFVKTGKLSFKDFANSLIEDLIRIQVRQAAAGLLSSAFSGGSSLFGGSGTMTGFSEGSSYSFGGGRAVGGGVDPDKFYEVNEKGPELFSQGGKTYLMSGSQGGYVTPIADTSRMSSQSSGSSNSGGGVAVHQTFHVAGDVSQETLNRMAEMSRQAAEQGAQSGYRMVMQDVHRNGPIRQRLSR